MDSNPVHSRIAAQRIIDRNWNRRTDFLIAEPDPPARTALAVYSESDLKERDKILKVYEALTCGKAS